MKYLIAFLFCGISVFSISQSSIPDYAVFVSNSQDDVSDNYDVFEHRRSKKIDVYPNPARHTLFIKGYFSHYKLFDDLGRKLLNGTDARIDVSHLRQGMYIITLHDQDGAYQSKKIRIQ